MKYYYFLFLCCIQPVIAQTYHPDKILLDGNNYDYRYHHMEPYFSYYPEKRPVINKDSTIISRGYIAEYEIIEQQLYLRDIKTPVDGNYQNLISNAKKVLPENATNLKMHWVDGLFDVGLGTPNYSNTKDTLNPVFNTYYIFEIKRGVVKSTNVFNYKQYKSFKDYQWERFKSSSEYHKVYHSLLQTALDPIEIEAHIYHHVLFYSKRNFLKKTI